MTERLETMLENWLPWCDGDLTFRLVQQSDGQYVQDMFDYPLAQGAAVLLMMKLESSYLNKDGIHFAIENQNHEMIGFFDIYDIHSCSCEIGYRIRHSFRRMGYAGSAVCSILKLLKEYEVKTVYARSEVENIASHKILYSNGFKMMKAEGNICYWEVSV